RRLRLSPLLLIVGLGLDQRLTALRRLGLGALPGLHLLRPSLRLGLGLLLLTLRGLRLSPLLLIVGLGLDQRLTALRRLGLGALPGLHLLRPGLGLSLSLRLDAGGGVGLDPLLGGLLAGQIAILGVEAGLTPVGAKSGARL